MKIKLLAASVLFLALGINTTEAQNRRGTKDQKQYGQQDRKSKDGYSKTDKWKNDKRSGKYQRGDNRFKSEKRMKKRYGKDYRKGKKHHRRHSFHRRYHRSHRF